jgi:hypothetical protein
VRETARRPAVVADESDTLQLFASLWAVAALFHVLGTSSSVPRLVADPTPVGVVQAALGICALAVLARPARTLPLVTLAVLGLVTAWLEAPLLGSHWALAAFVNLALLVATLVTRRGGTAEVFLPVARWCLVLFYAFAAFAKLNTDFLDATVSCSSYFFTRTFGPPAAGADLIPFATALTELSIPLLLLVPRTRVAGVLLGLSFHSVIALDVVHPFYDFSSVLTALFVLFLPGRFATSALVALRGRGTAARHVWTGLAAAVLVVAPWAGAGSGFALALVTGRLVLWFLLDAAVLVGVVVWLIRRRGPGPDADRPPLAVPAAGPLRALMLVPALVVATGLLPYLELRTAYAFTMYSNLRMVDGTSNHLLVRSSLPLAGRHTGLVTVVSSTDPGLDRYRQEGYLLPWDSFRAYLAEHPGVAVTYERGGRRVVVERAADDPALVGAPPLLVRKLLGLRAVDGGERSRCQTTFLPAL